MATPSTVHTALLLHTGKAAQPLLAGQSNFFKARAGEHYRIVKSVNGSEQLLDDVIANKAGNDLHLAYADGTELTLENYYIACSGVYSCEVSLPGPGNSVRALGAEGAAGTSLASGATLVYAHGGHDALMDMARGNSALQSTLAGLGGTEISYAPAAPNAASLGGGNLGWLAGLGAALGVAAAAGGGGGGGGSAPVTPPVTPPTTPSDITAPTVTAVALSAEHGVLVAGDVLKVSVTMSEATLVTGTPQLALDIGGKTVQASYVSGSGGTELVFSYTIEAGQFDGNGIAIAANAIALQGGKLLDAAGNAANLNHAPLPDDGNYLVDTLGAVVGTIAITSADGAEDRLLVAGDVVSVTVTMSKETTVSGAPTLALDIGGRAVLATYVSGSGGTELVFTYTIQAGQVDADGIGIGADALALNGGKLTDALGNVANLHHLAVPGNAAYLVDTIAPAVEAVALSAASGVPGHVLVAGDVLGVTVTMSEATQVAGTPHLALDIGGVKVYADYVSGSGSANLLFNYTIAAGDLDGNGIGIAANGLGLNDGTLTDQAGNTAVLTHAAQPGNGAYLVDALAPTASAVESVITNGGGATVKSSETGTAYLVHDSVSVSDLASITGAAGELWNAAPVTAAGQNTALGARGLADGGYHVYTVDAAGNLSAPSADIVTLASTFRFGGSGELVDLGSLNSNGGLSRIDLTGTGDNVLRLTLQDVLDRVSIDSFDNSNGWDDGSYNLAAGGTSTEQRHQLVIDGNIGDRVLSNEWGASWGASVGTVSNHGHQYAVYNQGLNAQLLVDLNVPIIAVL